MPDAFSADRYPTPEVFEATQREAKREKTYAAERKINRIRAAVIVFNSVLWAVFLDIPSSIDWMAWSVIGVANTYWILVWLLEPYRRLEIMTTSYFTSITDATLITFWLWGTGGFASPFYVVWYVSIVAVAFRYGLRETAVVSMFYVGCYVGLIAGLGEMAGNLGDLAVRSGYILLVGSLGGIVSEEVYHQTEEKVRMRQLMEDARSAEERFRRLLESAPDAILIADEEGRVVVSNTQAEHLFGYERDELLGTRFDELIPDVEAPSVRRPDADEDAGAPTHPIEATARRKDGGQAPVEVTMAPMSTGEGTLLSCIVRDVTDRKRAEEELERRNRELARSNAELEQFAYVASHDLQEPLRMVSSYVQLLERRYGDELDSDAHEFIGYATEGVRRMRDLIRDLLTFSQVGAVDRRLGPTDTEEVVREVLTSMQTSLEASDASVEVDDLPTVMADRSQIAQVFQNLISNGLKFQDDRPPRIEVSAERDGNAWVFSVRDNGIGIPDEYGNKIFVIFQRLHDRQDYEGTGIGLAICKKIVEGHRGRIWFESPPTGADRGTVFRFTLPVLRVTQGDGRGTSTQRISAVPPDGRSSMEEVPRTRLTSEPDDASQPA